MLDYNIFLIGFMGSGKSTVAKSLSRKLGTSCAEMDEMVVADQDMPITEIFDKHGEEYFRDVESEVLERITKEKHMVVSCGGGTVLRKRNVDFMKENGHIVLLTAKPETILKRVGRSTNRPILNGHMNVEYITELMDKRKDSYMSAAELIVATDDKSIAEITEEIIVELEKFDA